MRLSFHGADRDVTGSCHLVECAGRKFLIDCGLFQGSRELAEENAGAFGFDPASITLIHRAEDRDDLVGFITTRPVFEENGETVGPIGSIGTDRPVRGLGLGRVLLRAGINRLKDKGAGPINLEVVTINERALSLYESEGFLPKQSWEFWKAPRGTAKGS